MQVLHYLPAGVPVNAAACLRAAEQGAGGWRWQDSALMRSRAAIRGNILARCVPGRQSVAILSPHASQKGPRTGKEALRGNISPPCIQNELALARYALHVFKMPCKSPFGNASREDLAREGPFSLHGPLKSRTARESCHPSQRERPQPRRRPHGAAAFGARHPSPPNSASDREHGAALMARQPA